jgi:hypothetical protein
MFTIDKQANRINKLIQKSFKDLKFNERQHLQEWLAHTPEALGEPLLLIQKEFSGFNDTNERLDLLALDEYGNLVVIENKLDDTGRDVTWQVLKYAAYCSTLKKEQIKNIYQEYLNKYRNGENAEANLAEFFGRDFDEVSPNTAQTQRIILVVANFRKEVTSTVLWLMNYKLRIQCFKVTPYQFEEQLFLNVEQIIPMKDAEEYIISMADKVQENIITQEEVKTRYVIREEFWKEFLLKFNQKTQLFQNISPSKDNWIGTSSGLSGVSLNCVISKNYARVEIYINRGSTEENKRVFDELYSRKNEIEQKFGQPLTWERLSEKVTARIKFELGNVNYFEKEKWPTMIDFLVKNMIRLEETFRDEIKLLKAKLKA